MYSVNSKDSASLSLCVADSTCTLHHNNVLAHLLIIQLHRLFATKPVTLVRQLRLNRTRVKIIVIFYR